MVEYFKKRKSEYYFAQPCCNRDFLRDMVSIEWGRWTATTSIGHGVMLDPQNSEFIVVDSLLFLQTT